MCLYYLFSSIFICACFSKSFNEVMDTKFIGVEYYDSKKNASWAQEMLGDCNRKLLETYPA